VVSPVKEGVWTCVEDADDERSPAGSPHLRRSREPGRPGSSR
jgi:hypothetical protein